MKLLLIGLCSLLLLAACSMQEVEPENKVIHIFQSDEGAAFMLERSTEILPFEMLVYCHSNITEEATFAFQYEDNVTKVYNLTMLCDQLK